MNLMKYFNSLVFSKTIFFLITSVTIISLNLTPLVADTLHAPPGRTFALLHNNAQDFFFYQSLMNQGASGSWLTKDPYTSEPHQSSIIFSYFLWLGKIAHILGLSYAYIYHFLRIALSIAFLFFIFYFLYFLKVPYPRLTYLFFLFASPLLHTINDNGTRQVVPFMYWWTGMDPLRRVAYLPHHMFGALALVLSVIFILKYLQTQDKKYLLWTIILAFLLGFIHTPSLFIILIILPASALLFILSQKQNLKKYIKLEKNYRIIGLLGYWFIGLLVLLYMISQTSRGFPWSQYINWEKRFQFPLDKELIGALGILTPFATIGSIKALISKQFKWILIASWFFVPVLIIPLAPILSVSNIRFIQGIPYLPLAILSSLGLKTILNDKILQLLSQKLRLSKTWLTLLTPISIGFLFLIVSFPALSWSLKDQLKEYWPIYGNVYLDNRLSSAFSYINKNFPKNTITLGSFYTGNYLPSFTHTVSFIGHFGYTYNIDEKQPLVMKFFQNQMKTPEARQFFQSTHARLVIQGPEEKPLYPGYLYPEFLKPVYDRPEITIYTSNF